MARVLGFLLGELRGKLGGTVFSRNKSGAIVRAKVTPVNPQTVRQQTARFRFGNSSILYQGLTASAKSCWQVFANTHFNPLKGNNTGIYSGGNAFVAMQQSVGQGNAYLRLPQITNGPNNYTVTQVPYTVLGASPAAPTSNTIMDNLGNPHPINISNISVDKNGEVAFNISFDDVVPTSTLTYSSFVNAENQNFGIGFYMSNNLKFEGAKPNTALKLNFSNTGVVTNLTNSATPGPIPMNQPTQLITPNSVVEADIRDFPCVGDCVLVTPFIRSSLGAQKLMTPQYVIVSP